MKTNQTFTPTSSVTGFDYRGIDKINYLETTLVEDKRRLRKANMKLMVREEFANVSAVLLGSGVAGGLAYYLPNNASTFSFFAYLAGAVGLSYCCFLSSKAYLSDLITKKLRPQIALLEREIEEKRDSLRFYNISSNKGFIRYVLAFAKEKRLAALPDDIKEKMADGVALTDEERALRYKVSQDFNKEQRNRLQAANDEIRRGLTRKMNRLSSSSKVYRAVTRGAPQR